MFSTVTLGCLIMCLVTLGFAIQNLFYCPSVTEAEGKVENGKVMVWLFFSLLVVFASSGFVAWLIKLLALWGPTTEAGRGKVLGFTIQLDVFSLGLGSGIAYLIVACQRLCCPRALEQYVEVHVEDVEMGIMGTSPDDGGRDGTALK